MVVLVSFWSLLDKSLGSVKVETLYFYLFILLFWKVWLKGEVSDYSLFEKMYP